MFLTKIAFMYILKIEMIFILFWIINGMNILRNNRFICTLKKLETMGTIGVIVRGRKLLFKFIQLFVVCIATIKMAINPTTEKRIYDPQHQARTE